MKDLLHNPLLVSVSAIFEQFDNSLFTKSESLLQVTDDLNLVATFFDIDEKSAAVFAIIICNQISGESSSVTKVMKRLGFKPLDFMKTLEVLTDWKKNGYLRLSVVRYNRTNEDYVFIKEVIDAVLYNDKTKLDIIVPETQIEALFKIRHFIKSIISAIEKYLLVEVILNYVEKFDQFELIREVLTAYDLNEEEKAVLFYIIAELQYGIDEFDLEIILDYFEHESGITYRFKERVISGKSQLFAEEYLEFETPDFADFTSVSVGDRIKKHISNPLGKTNKKYFNPKLCAIIKPETIETTPLFFNLKTKNAIDEVLHLTSNEYTAVMNRFQAQGLHPGLTMLFYGTPGTGKTELVKQLAKRNNRVILIVDSAAIRSKWVGESEKNIRRIFVEYKAATSVFEETPILLFNECDALLGKRNDVQSSVDQMNNAMQNMLLQELEDFKGIFIATTNLIDNLDKAFDRRILYKLNFDQPDETTRYDILSSQFPMFEAKTIAEISKTYILSGGQIQNLKKKFLVEQILFNGEDLNEEKFKLCIEEEISFRKSTKSKIGFSN